MKLTNITSAKNTVIFDSQGYELVGSLFMPENFDSQKTYSTVVITQPFNQIKEQTASVYAEKLAQQGFIALAFDHRGFGESEGKLRSYQYSPAMVESITDAISFVRMQNFVDSNKVYGLGICAGATNIVTTALTDKRLNAIATVSGMLNNAANFFAQMDRDTAVAALKAAGEVQQKYYETGVQENVDILNLGTKPAIEAPNAVKEGYDFYMTARGGQETHPNYTHEGPLFVHMDYPRYNATAMASHLYTPFLGIYGSLALPDTAPLTLGFFEAASEPKELLEIDGASHVSLYDIDKDVDRAVTGITDFFHKY